MRLLVDEWENLPTPSHPECNNDPRRTPSIRELARQLSFLLLVRRGGWHGVGWFTTEQSRTSHPSSLSSASGVTVLRRSESLANLGHSNPAVALVPGANLSEPLADASHSQDRLEPMIPVDEPPVAGRTRAPELLGARAEVHAVTLRMFDWLFVIMLVLGGPTLAIAIWRTLKFSAHGVIAVYVAFFVAMVMTLGLRRRIPLWLVSAVLCAVGVSDAIVTLLIYGFASAGVLLLFISTLSAGIFFGLRGGLLALTFGIVVLTVAAICICTKIVPLQVDVSAYLQSPAGWMVQIIHYALLSLFVVVMIHAIQSRLSTSLEALQQRTTELTLANQTLQAEAAARQRAEVELSESEEQYRMVSEHMTDTVASQDMDLRIKYVSPSVARMFGYTDAEARTLDMTQLMTPESLAGALGRFREYVTRAQEHDVAVPLAEYEYVRKDGSTFWGELSATFLRDAQGCLNGSVVVVRDVTDRRRATAEKERLQEQLQQSDKLRVLGQLAGGIAHDFNNQLAGIMGYAEMMSSESRGQGFVGEASRVVLQCAQRAADLTGKLLAFARKGTYQTVPVDMHDIIREVSSILERSIDKTVTLRLDLAAPTAVVIGDPTQLQTALLNLAINARDAMPLGGELRLRSAVVDAKVASSVGVGTGILAEEYLEVCVEDTGVGMDARTLEHIFEPFFTTKSAGGGTGLGLAAVHGTVTAHSGGVWVESEPGVGTTFRLYLPLSPEMQVVDKKRLPAGVRGSGRLLVVEDEPAVRRVLQSYLRRQGYEIVIAADGSEAVELFRCAAGAFDLVLLDLVLPMLDGPSVFSALRALEPEAKILLMSGHGEDSVVSDLMQRGAVDILRKPFTLAHLSQCIASALPDRNASKAQG
jgi:PAS domain S-box-containing protein